MPAQLHLQVQGCTWGRRNSLRRTLGATSHVSLLPEDAHRVLEARWPSHSNGRGGGAMPPVTPKLLGSSLRNQLKPLQHSGDQKALALRCFFDP